MVISYLFCSDSSLVRKYAISIGRVVASITKTATTFVTGLWRGRVNSLSIQIGIVCCCPAVNVVTITSSNERANESIAPARRAVEIFGKIT